MTTKTSNDVTWILVADDKGARVFHAAGHGEPWAIKLDTQHGKNAVQGDKKLEDRGTQGGAHHASNHQGALKTSDAPADKSEHLFIRELSHFLEKGLADNVFGHLILVAPPHFLGILRESLSRGVSETVYASVAKDYGHMPLADLHKHLAESLPVI